MSQYGRQPGEWANSKAKAAWVVPVAVVIAIAAVIGVLLALA